MKKANRPAIREDSYNIEKTTLLVPRFKLLLIVLYNIFREVKP